MKTKTFSHGALSLIKFVVILLITTGLDSCESKEIYTGPKLDSQGKPVPYNLLNPPSGITPAQTREPFSWSFNELRKYPKMTWTPTERKKYEKKLEWFHEAKFGIFFDYLSGGKWTSEEWNKWVDDVDVEKVASQANELGVGYVIITLGQNQVYSCAPNPVIDKHWKGQFTSKRDLPMDLYNALKKYNIPMMLYFATDNQYMMPLPSDSALKGNDRYDRWVEVARWYSDHYGTKCRGWWVDGLMDFRKDYCIDIHNALKSGNPDAIVASGQLELSDFLHGHCMPDWNRQKTVVKPFFGRWDPDFGIQWHVFQYIGSTWGMPGVSKNTDELVQYAEDIVKGGGVITFDLGTFDEGCFYQLPETAPDGINADGKRIGPKLEIQQDQFEVLKAVRDRLKDITPSNGTDMGGKTYHVSVNGNDKNPGTQRKPMKTISAAALLAMPGDVINVHAGTYREQINPPRGGNSEWERITYQAEGEVIIKGSEVVENWTSENGQIWKAILPNDFFGRFNPFNDYLSGDWYVNTDNKKTRTGAVYLNGHWLSEAANLEEVMNKNIANKWFAIVDESHTTIYANFGDKNPNNELVEVNARQTVFYPEKTGINYITIHGFTLTQAATPWAPPTAEQKAIIGTNWSKGWIIEDNNISYSICSGIALGKHGDEFDNTAASTTEGYYETINRALKNGWNKENIGHHIVRNNRISHCEQAGIVGSLGCIFSTITSNEIHDIHVKNWYFGYEMAGIKFHGAVNTLIHSNHIYRCNRGLWLDWMAQGTTVSRNLFHDNDRENGYDQADLYMEVNHGPVLVANNLFLSDHSILNRSNGTAYVHNLTTGSIRFAPEENRETPFLQPNSTEIMGYAKSIIEDEKWINNIIVGDKSNFYFFDTWDNHNIFNGNVYLNGAKPPKSDMKALVIDDYQHDVKITEKTDGFYLEFNFDSQWGKNANSKPVTTERLGESKYTRQPVVYPDGTAVTIDIDFLGNPYDKINPSPGPFEIENSGKQKLKIWPFL